MQIQISSETDKELKEHMQRFGYKSKNDFLTEIVLREWLADKLQALEEYKRRMQEKD